MVIFMRNVRGGGTSSNYIVSVFFGGKYVGNPSRSLSMVHLPIRLVTRSCYSSRVECKGEFIFLSLKTQSTILNVFRSGKLARFTSTLPS